jgi:hypothetical protein
MVVPSCTLVLKCVSLRYYILSCGTGTDPEVSKQLFVAREAAGFKILMLNFV